jgi:hypothetical protein
MARIMCFAIGAFVLPVVGAGTAAADCAAQMSGAREGRPSNAAEILSAWPWSEPTCWLQWREKGATKQARDKMRAECIAGAGREYLHFQEDRGATSDGSNTCIFRLAGAAAIAPRAPTAPASPPPVQPRPAAGVAPTIPTPKASGHTGKCPDGNDARRCVTLEQRGRSGRWYNFRLVNGCSTTFNVNVFHCSAEWAGGCKVEKMRAAACETTGSVAEGKQSWDREAELRW